MRTYFFLFLLLFFSASALSRQPEAPPPQTASGYMEKSRVQRTGAFVLMGGGAILTLVGLGKAVNHMFDEEPGGRPK